MELELVKVGAMVIKSMITGGFTAFCYFFLINFVYFP